MAQRRILYLPTERLSRDILSDEARDILESLGEVTWNRMDRDYTADELKAIIPGVHGVVTSWGSPALTTDVLEAADSLQIVGHCAGSVKHLMTKEGFDKGVVLLSAAAIIADSVAEYTLWAMLDGQRLLSRYPARMRDERGWRKADDGWGNELYYKKVGLISASMVGRRVMKLLQPWGCDVMVYDPYLSSDAAEQLGVRRVSLEELMSTSDIISVHAPTTPETKELISAQHIASIRDGVLFINSARTWVLDEPALIAELAKGRFRAYLDVFGKEPLADDSPLRSMPNVFITPHVAGASAESRSRMVLAIAQDMQRFFDGQPLQYAVTWERLQIMA